MGLQGQRIIHRTEKTDNRTGREREREKEGDKHKTKNYQAERVRHKDRLTDTKRKKEIL